jgi:hypothetical protein
MKLVCLSLSCDIRSHSSVGFLKRVLFPEGKCLLFILHVYLLALLCMFGTTAYPFYTFVHSIILLYSQYVGKSAGEINIVL